MLRLPSKLIGQSAISELSENASSSITHHQSAMVRMLIASLLGMSAQAKAKAKTKTVEARHFRNGFFLVRTYALDYHWPIPLLWGYLKND